LELSIDTASEMASLALSREGEVVAELSWRCRRTHTVELWPAIDALLRRAGCGLGDLKAVFVCLGPGTYMGLRVGIAAAQGLAYALRLPTVGVGRLEAEAYGHLWCGRPVVAMHRAGRGEVAWAAYAPGGEEVVPPRLSAPEAAVAEAPAGALFCGEVPQGMAAAIEARGGQVVPGAAGQRRAAYVAEVGYRRLLRGEAVPPAQLRPIYLREAV